MLFYITWLVYVRTQNVVIHRVFVISIKVYILISITYCCCETEVAVIGGWFCL